MMVWEKPKFTVGKIWSGHFRYTYFWVPDPPPPPNTPFEHSPDQLPHPSPLGNARPCRTRSSVGTSHGGHTGPDWPFVSNRQWRCGWPHS